MSVYKHKDSPFYHFDFQLKGNRFHGSTGKTSKREAEAFEGDERERAKQQVRHSTAVSTKLDYVAGRYWDEIGQHHAGADTTWRDLERLIGYFGAGKFLSEIKDDDLARLVAWRRGHRVTRHGKGLKNADAAPLIAPATVNRSSTEVLKELFTRAKDWGVRFEHEPDWRRHFLKEPQERVRELHGSETDQLDEATRDDYRPIFSEFTALSGLRMNECLLQWSEVNWDARKIVKQGKGDKRVTVPITDAIREILWPLRGHHRTMVFTYVAKRTRKPLGLVKGRRHPITYNGLKSARKVIRAVAGVTDSRFHDYRHDFATKLLRETRNLKLVQKALNHADIKTTTKYAHVLDDEVAAGLDAMQKSRKKSRNPLREVS